MRKYVALVACLLLITFSFVLTIGGPGVEFGRGEGVDKQIENIDEVAEILQMLSGGMPLSLSAEGTGPAPEYTSATFEISTQNVITVSMPEASIHTEVIAEDYYCITEDCQYYKSSGTVLMSINNETISFDVDAEIYIDLNRVLIKYNKFNMNAQMMNIAGKNFIGKWYTMTGEFGFSEIFEQASTQTMNVLGLFGSYITEYKNTSFSMDSDKKYSLNEYTAKEVLKDMYAMSADDDSHEIGHVLSQNAQKCDFTVDLSNYVEPVINFESTCNVSNYPMGGVDGMNLSVSFSDMIVMKYVNNTVVRFPETNVYTEEDFISDVAKDMGVMM